MDKNSFRDWMAKAKPGDTTVYAKGQFLPRTPECPGSVAYEAMELGFVRLYQRRARNAAGASDYFEYVAQRVSAEQAEREASFHAWLRRTHPVPVRRAMR